MKAAASVRGRRVWHWLRALLRVGVLGWLLFGGLREKGLGYYDEAYNVLEARFVADCVRLGMGFVTAGVGGESVGLRQYVKTRGRPGGYYPSYGKPAHTMILAAGLLASGGADWGALLAMASCGAIWILALWRWGLLLLGRISARWGALLLGCSAFFLIYARQALAEADSVALMTVGLCLLARIRRGKSSRPRLALFLAGLVFGISFAANYRWFWIPLLLVWENWLYAGAGERRSGKWPDRSAQLAWVLVGVAVPLILAELPGLVLQAYFHRLGLPPPFETYWEQLARLYFFHPTSEKGFHLTALPTYPYLLWRWTSPLFVLVLGVGAWRLLRRRSDGRAGLLLLAPPVIMLTFYSIYVYNFARFATLSLPFLALVGGKGVETAGSLASRRAAAIISRPLRITWIMGLGVLVAGLPAALAARAVVSPWPEVATWIERRGNGLCASTELHVMRCVYGKEKVIGIGPGMRRIPPVGKGSVRWVVLGPLRRYWGEIPVVDSLTAGFRPVARWENPFLDHQQYAFEHNVNFRQALQADLFRGLEWVEVYALKGSSDSGPETTERARSAERK